jgi:two-component system LytT family response regulator
MGRPIKSNKLNVWINNRKIQIRKKDICYCQAEGCYSRIFLIDGESYLLSRTLKCVEKQLPGEYFFRCHRSYLVNMKEITSIDVKRRIAYQKLYQIPISSKNLANLLNERYAYLINKK